MPVLTATPKAAAANSYVTVARADELLRTRLYTDAWDAATGPTAEGWQVNGSVGFNDTKIPVDSGTGVFTAGMQIKFQGHSTIYKAKTDLSEPGQLQIGPGVVSILADDEAVERVTPNEKEKALIWATNLLDRMMVWHGTKRELEAPLRWPRSGVIDEDGDFYDFDLIPTILERGTAELALSLLEGDSFSDPELLGLGISDVSLGPLKVKIDPSQKEEVIPRNILALLSPLGFLESEASVGTRIMNLRRG